MKLKYTHMYARMDIDSLDIFGRRWAVSSQVILILEKLLVKFNIISVFFLLEVWEKQQSTFSIIKYIHGEKGRES